MSTKYVKRFEAVFLCHHSNGPKLSYSKAAKVIKKSKEFVRKWVERYKVFKNVDDFSERGKTRKTTKKEDRAILQLFERTPTMRLRVAKARLAKRGIHVSVNTIRQRLKENDV